jgi:hypothetical protein
MNNKEKTKKGIKKNRVGAPSKWDPNFSKMAYEIMCLGATLEKLGRILGVSKETICQWQKQKPEFSDSFQKARDCFDSENIEKALFKKSTGFFSAERTFELPHNYITFSENTDKELIDNILSEMEPILVKIVKKYHPPSDQAIRFWLMNRNPQRWSKDGALKIETDRLFFTHEEVDQMLNDEQ